MHNLITDVQKQRVRGVPFALNPIHGRAIVKMANQGITVATGDLRVFDPTTPPMAAAGMGGGDLVVINDYYNWGECLFGGEYMSTVMHEIMHNLGFGHSYDEAGSEIMGSDPDITSSSEASFPDNGDINSGQYLYRLDSMDIDMYRFEVGAGGGDFSAETIAQRMANASLLNTELILFDANGNVLAKKR